MLGRQDFDRRPEQRGETLQVVDADLRQRPDLALVIPGGPGRSRVAVQPARRVRTAYRPASNPLPEGAKRGRSEEHTSELQSLRHLVCRLLLEKKNKKIK